MRIGNKAIDDVKPNISSYRIQGTSTLSKPLKQLNDTEPQRDQRTPGGIRFEKEFNLGLSYVYQLLFVVNIR